MSGLAEGDRARTGAAERDIGLHELDAEVAETCGDPDRVTTGDVILPSL